MIFLTVGHQTPFDRLVEVVDRWAGENRHRKVVAQIGSGKYQPQHIEWRRWLSPTEFESQLEQCAGVVAHAGTGTIIKALLKKKPLLVLPRRADLGETRNDHQIGTARHFSSQGYLSAAFCEKELVKALDELAAQTPRLNVAAEASPELLLRISTFLERVENLGLEPH